MAEVMDMGLLIGGSQYYWACFNRVGKIISVSSVVDERLFHGMPDRILLPGDTYSEGQIKRLINSFYVSAGELTERPEFSLQMELSEEGSLLVDGVPEGAWVSVEAVSLEAMSSQESSLVKSSFFADGTRVEISVEYPGKYLLKFGQFPYQDYETTVQING